MKHFNYPILNSLMVLLLLFSCSDEEPQPLESSEIVITGYKESIYLELENGDGTEGRLSGDDFVFSNLSILLLDLEGRVVSAKHYTVDPYIQNNIQIPDTISFGNLSTGQYQIIASTIPRYDLFENDDQLLISKSAVSHQPIFIGRKQIDVTQNVQHTVIDMINKSAKLTISLSEPLSIDEYVNISFPIPPNTYYSLLEDNEVEFENSDGGWWGWYPHINIDFYNDYAPESITSKTIYVLPNELNELVFDYSNHSKGMFFNHQFQLSESVNIASDQHLKITLDVKALMDEESSMMALGWVDIIWEELDEIMIP